MQVTLVYDASTGKVSLHIGEMIFETYRSGVVKYGAYRFHLTSFFGCLGSNGQVDIYHNNEYVSAHTTQDLLQLTLGSV